MALTSTPQAPGVLLVLFAALGCGGEPGSGDGSPSQGGEANGGAAAGASGSSSGGAGGTDGSGVGGNAGAAGSSAGAAGSSTGAAGGSAGIAGASGAATNGGSSAAGGAGTGGSGGAPPTPMGGAGAGGAPGGGGSSGGALGFRNDVWPVFEMVRDPAFVYPGAGSFASCVTGGVCHGGSSAGAGLRMIDAATAYEMLLEVPSQSSLCAGTVRVVPENPDESCLVLFYEGRLRDELGWVDDAEIDLVRAWIAQGALP